MPDPAALLFAELIAQGGADPAADAWLRDGLRRWLRADCAVPLERVLRLPASPEAARRARRDFWLCAASRALPATLTTWARAQRILRAAARRRAGLPTQEGPAFDNALMLALAAGAPMPETAEGVRRLIG